MKRPLLAICLVAVATLGAAREKYDAKTMDETAIAALRGQRLAIAGREPPALRIATAGAHDQGTREVRRAIDDPADLIANELASALVRQFGMQARAGNRVLVKSGKPAELAALLPDTDYVLHVFTNDRRVTLVPRTYFEKEARYWVGYGVRVSLLFRATGRAVFSANCYADTEESPIESSTMESLGADGARRYRELSRALAWQCLRRIAHYTPLPEDAVAAAPPAL
jgi:hypothetical protein